MGAHAPDSISQLTLPPGFRFYPTDEELLVQYLCRKVAGQPFSVQVIGEIDLYKFDPWILPSKATFGEKEWYFFSPRDRKYPNGTRPNRVAGSGYWKATGTDKLITAEGRRVGIKKALVFYVGKAPKGAKTNWIMHEYRLIEHSRKNGSARLDDWVLCRIYEKKSSAEKAGVLSRDPCTVAFSSYRIDDMLDSLPEMDPRSFHASGGGRPLRRDGEDDATKRRFSIQSLGSDSFDWAGIAAGSAMSEFMNQPPLTRAPAPGTADGDVDGDYGSVYGGAHPATASRVGPVVDDSQGRNGAPGGLPPCYNTGAVTQADALGHFGVSHPPPPSSYPPPPSSCFGFARR